MTNWKGEEAILRGLPVERRVTRYFTTHGESTLRRARAACRGMNPALVPHRGDARCDFPKCPGVRWGARWCRAHAKQIDRHGFLAPLRKSGGRRSKSGKRGSARGPTLLELAAARGVRVGRARTTA